MWPALCGRAGAGEPASGSPLGRRATGPARADPSRAAQRRSSGGRLRVLQLETAGADQVNAGAAISARGRKVRAPKGKVLANGQSGRPGGKCHREQTAEGPSRREVGQARVKRCGKSAPRRQRCRWHGKPHLEQERIGRRCGGDSAGGLPARSLRVSSLEAAGNRGPRGMFTAQRWEQNSAYGPLRHFRPVHPRASRGRLARARPFGTVHRGRHARTHPHPGRRR